MDPATIALICAASFGTVVVLGAFIRMALLSRDKDLNDEAQRRALAQEVTVLENMRNEMQSNRRFDSHYKVLGANKDAIVYFDQRIDETLGKKQALIERYAKVTIEESGAIVKRSGSPASKAVRKEVCDKLKDEIDRDIKLYDEALEDFQSKRASVWDSHTNVQEMLLTEEQLRNKNLDEIYKQHSGLLEKVYIRHIDDSENIARDSIMASTTTFQSLIVTPIQFLLRYFNLSSGITLTTARVEIAARANVQRAENDANNPDSTRNDKAKDIPVVHEPEVDEARAGVALS